MTASWSTLTEAQAAAIRAKDIEIRAHEAAQPDYSSPLWPEWNLDNGQLWLQRARLWPADESQHGLAAIANHFERTDGDGLCEW